MLSTVFSIPFQVASDSSSRDPDLRRPLREFVAGAENAALLVAADSVATHQHYNPLFVYGPTGVGKSHLLEALGEEFRRQRQQSTAVLYLTAADYLRCLSQAHELDATGELRRRHRAVDLLIIDDLHQLADKTRAQQELLSTLDVRLDAGRLTLISSRTGPAELEAMLPGLQSRLWSGLALPISQPAAETREAIVDELSEHYGLSLTDTAKRLLVQPGKRATRRLETVSQLNNTLLELRQLCGQDSVTASMVKELTWRPPAGLDLSLRQITRHTARHFQLRVQDLTGPSRRQSTVQARGIAVYLARRLMASSFEELGRHFGGRDHSTIMHAFHKTEAQVQSDPVMQMAVDDISQRLGVP